MSTVPFQKRVYCHMASVQFFSYDTFLVHMWGFLTIGVQDISRVSSEAVRGSLDAGPGLLKTLPGCYNCFVVRIVWTSWVVIRVQRSCRSCILLDYTVQLYHLQVIARAVREPLSQWQSNAPRTTCICWHSAPPAFQAARVAISNWLF